MTTKNGKVREIIDSPRAFSPARMDPRIASTVAIRDGMIAQRREAGLPDFPPRPLYPDRQVRFAPEDSPSARHVFVAE